MTSEELNRRWFFLDGATPVEPANDGGVVEHPIDEEKTRPLPRERNNDVPANDRRDRALAKLKHAQASEVLRLRGLI